MTVLIGLDVKSTGLDINNDPLLSIALRAYNIELEPLDEGIELVRSFSKRMIKLLKEGADPYVQKMYEDTGLWDKLPQGEYDDVIRTKITEYIKSHMAPTDKYATPGNRSIVFVGSSIKFDWYKLTLFHPEVVDLVNYRVIDVTTLKLVGDIYWNIPQIMRRNTHNPMEDIDESMSDLAYVLEGITYIRLTKFSQG